MNKEILLTNTEFPEDHIQDILDIDPAQQPSQGMSRGSEVFGCKLLALADNVEAALQ